MLGPVWTFPHGPPYCLRWFHAPTRSKFRCLFLIIFIFNRLCSLVLGGNINFFQPLAWLSAADIRRYGNVRRQGEVCRYGLTARSMAQCCLGLSNFDFTLKPGDKVAVFDVNN